MTPQILLNALLDNVVPLSQLSLIFFDECHHTTKEHPYNQIMALYMDHKLQMDDSYPLPQARCFNI